MTETSWSRVRLTYHWACVFARVDCWAATGNSVCWRHGQPMKCASGIFNQRQRKFFPVLPSCERSWGIFAHESTRTGLDRPPLCSVLSQSVAHKGALCVNLQGGGKRCMEVQGKFFWKNAAIGSQGENAGKVPSLTSYSPHRKCFSKGWGWKNIWILSNKTETPLVVGLIFLLM